MGYLVDSAVVDDQLVSLEWHLGSQKGFERTSVLMKYFRVARHPIASGHISRVFPAESRLRHGSLRRERGEQPVIAPLHCGAGHSEIIRR